MARRSDHTREELYELIVATAHDMIEKDGLNALSTRKLAVKVGYTAGTIYNIFKNIDDLILHVHARTLESVYHAIEPALKHAKAEDRLQAMVELYLSFIQQHSHSWSSLFEPGNWQNKQLPDWYQEKVEHLFSLVEKGLEPLFPKERQDELNLSARVFWSSIHGICTLAITDKLDVVSRHKVEIMTRSFLANYITGLKINMK